jgi:DNA-binding IscR family transcriptional regulator
MTKLEEAAADITLIAVLRRIQRKTDIMALDADTANKAEMKQNIREVQLLIGIALRCIGAEND